jgi:hypothetical protein
VTERDNCHDTDVIADLLEVNNPFHGTLGEEARATHAMWSNPWSSRTN